MTQRLLSLTVEELSRRHPAFAEFLTTARAYKAKPDRTLADWIGDLDDEQLGHIGLDRAQVLTHLDALVGRLDGLEHTVESPLQSLTLLGGIDKLGKIENLDLTLRPGDVVCVVGPTGSGKSRLLADIESWRRVTPRRSDASWSMATN